MSLDKQFRREFEAIIKDYISTTIEPIHKSRLHKIWKIDGNEFDFLYGETIGYLTGIAEGMLLSKYGRELIPDETNEIFEIIETHAGIIRESLNPFK